MGVTPIVVLEGNEYRIAQNDIGSPFVQFLDQESGTWIAVRHAPAKMADLEGLLVKYVIRSGRAAKELKKLKAELAGYKNGFEERGAQIEEMTKIKDRLATFTEAT